MRFYPDDPAAFSKAHLRVRLNSRGGAQLRLDGIGALEAASGLLSHLGFRTVERDEDGTVTAATPEQMPGHIMIRFADKYGRAIAFSPGSGPGRATDGGQVHLTCAGCGRQRTTGCWKPVWCIRRSTRCRKQLRDDLVFLPKLFRRLVDYLGLDETGGVSLAGFAAYLDGRDDRLVVVSSGQTIRLTVAPEDIVFAEG